MSRIISYRGKLDDGIQEKINLKTIKGKVGYRIKKFQIIQTAPGTDAVELTAKIYKKDQSASIAAGVDFTESDLIAVSVYNANAAAYNYPTSMTIVFDNEVFNQNIFIYAYDTVAAAQTNYYLELETISLNKVESTQLTLKSLRSTAAK